MSFGSLQVMKENRKPSPAIVQCHEPYCVFRKKGRFSRRCVVAVSVQEDGLSRLPSRACARACLESPRLLERVWISALSPADLSVSPLSPSLQTMARPASRGLQSFQGTLYVRVCEIERVNISFWVAKLNVPWPVGGPVKPSKSYVAHVMDN
jgi:hypothetical protein